MDGDNEDSRQIISAYWTVVMVVEDLATVLGVIIGRNSRDFKFGRGMNCWFKMFLEKTKKICCQYDENGKK